MGRPPGLGGAPSVGKACAVRHECRRAPALEHAAKAVHMHVMQALVDAARSGRRGRLEAELALRSDAAALAPVRGVWAETLPHVLSFQEALAFEDLRPQRIDTLVGGIFRLANLDRQRERERRQQRQVLRIEGTDTVDDRTRADSAGRAQQRRVKRDYDLEGGQLDALRVDHYRHRHLVADGGEL